MMGGPSPVPLPNPAPVPLRTSSPPSCPELDLSLPVSPNPKTNQAPDDPKRPSPQNSHVLNSIHPKCKLQPKPARPTNRTQSKPRRPLQHLTNPTHSNPRLRRGEYRQGISEDPLVVTVTAELSNLPTNAAVSDQSALESRNRSNFHGRGAELPSDAANQETLCLLEEAELNSTLAVRAELQQLQGLEFNSQKALQETLQKSAGTKSQLNARVSEGVNVPPSQQLYRALVSVSVEEEDLIGQAVRDKLLLVSHARSHGNKEVQLEKEGPFLLQFFQAKQLREKPLLLEEGLSSRRPPLSVRPAPSTFDLYRRHARWQAGL